MQAAPVEEVKREPFDLDAKIKEMDDAFQHMQTKAMNALGPMNAAMVQGQVKTNVVEDIKRKSRSNSRKRGNRAAR